MVEVEVSRIGIDSSTNAHVVVLRERLGQRYLPIWIGSAEADAIIMELNHLKRERPMTHDLMKALVLALGGELQRVAISRVHQRTYFAELHLSAHGKLIQVDARPSDSIALALRLEAPIFVHEDLLAEPDDDDDADSPTGDSPRQLGAPSELTPDELKAYLAHLQPEDFGKFRP